MKRIIRSVNQSVNRLYYFHTEKQYVKNITYVSDAISQSSICLEKKNASFGKGAFIGGKREEPALSNLSSVRA